MGVFPEPALCADDVSRLVPNGTEFDDAVTWLPRAGRATRRRNANRNRTLAALAAGLMIGAVLPQDALAPAAAAHDRIDVAPVVVPADSPPAWGGVPLLDQEPATAEIIAHDLAGLTIPAQPASALPELALPELALPHLALPHLALPHLALPAPASSGPAPGADRVAWGGDELAADVEAEADPEGLAAAREARDEGREAARGDDAQVEPGAERGDEILTFGAMRVQRRLVETILRAAQEAQVDPAYMMALADKESSFSTDVKAATSSAEGLFQFVSGTWLEMIRDFGARYGFEAEAAAVTGRGGGITVSDEAMRERVLGLRRDPYVSALMAAELIKRDRARIEARVGRELKTSELYLAHFLGTSSAGRFLALTTEKPRQVAQKIFRAAARANRSLFTERAGRRRRGLTVAEVHERLDGMIDRRLSRYEGVAALAPQQAEKQERQPEAAPIIEPMIEGRLRLSDAGE